MLWQHVILRKLYATEGVPGFTFLLPFEISFFHVIMFFLSFLRFCLNVLVPSICSFFLLNPLYSVFFHLPAPFCVFHSNFIEVGSSKHMLRNAGFKSCLWTHLRNFVAFCGCTKGTLYLKIGYDPFFALLSSSPSWFYHH